MTIYVAACCRYWPVLGLNGMGKCGYCGEVPEMVWSTSSTGTRLAIWSDDYKPKETS